MRPGGEVLRRQRWARGVRSRLPPAILAARGASHPCLSEARRPAPCLPLPCVQRQDGIFVFLHSRSGSLSRRAGKRLRIDPVRCVGGLSAGRRKIAPHGRRRCRKSRPLPPSAVAELRGSRVAGKASCPGPLAGAGVLGTAGKKFSLYRRLERFVFEKGKREVWHSAACPKSGGKTVFFHDMTGVWFEAPSASNGKRFRGCWHYSLLFGGGSPLALLSVSVTAEEVTGLKAVKRALAGR